VKDLIIGSENEDDEAVDKPNLIGSDGEIHDGSPPKLRNTLTPFRSANSSAFVCRL
jgi:hypothetical protein